MYGQCTHLTILGFVFLLKIPTNCHYVQFLVSHCILKLPINRVLLKFCKCVFFTAQLLSCSQQLQNIVLLPSLDRKEDRKCVVLLPLFLEVIYRTNFVLMYIIVHISKHSKIGGNCTKYQVKVNFCALGYYYSKGLMKIKVF